MSAVSVLMVTELVTRLRAAFGTALAVDEFPNQPDPKRFVHPRGAVWVGYAGSSYGSPSSLGVPVQDREMHFDFTVLTRQLHGAAGASSILESVREALHGVRLAAGGSPLFLQNDGFRAYSDGVWRHSLVLATTRPSIPPTASGDDEMGPKLVRARFEHAAESFDVPAPPDPPEQLEEPEEP